MAHEPGSQEALEPDRGGLPDPDGEGASAERHQRRAGAAAAYAAAQHAAAGTRSGADGTYDLDSDPGSDPEVEAGAGVDPDVETAAPGPEGDPRAGATHDGVRHADGDPELASLDIDELTARAEKADEYLSLAQRTQADFENYRKRAARDAALAQERGITKLAKELLPAIDNLDRALAAALLYASGSADPDPEPTDSADAEDRAAADSQLIDGLRLVHAEVLAALARVGIEPFSPVGEQFDPQHHEAVAQAPVDGQASGTVVEVYQQGFRFGESVLRPARVLVAA